ncbi:hypothetical protein TNCV_3586101 [Trichonephila clavipes]|nr:hypothetical protein TNCV_3586101 [Trichonephila clavipes]
MYALYCVVVTNTTCLMVSDRGPSNSLWETARCTPVISRSFVHHISDSLKEEHPGGGQMPLTSLPLPSTSQEDL